MRETPRQSPPISPPTPSTSTNRANLFEGRQAIEEALTAFFAENPGYQLDVDIDTIRFVSPGVAIEDGTTTLTRPEGAATDYSHYTTVHVKTAGKWLAASVREHAPKDRREHRAQLQQLEWLLGDWVDEDDDSIVEFSCQAVDNGNFLLRQFTVKIAGQEAMSGTQRIGWDPVSGKLRAWIFDSEGGYARRDLAPRRRQLGPQDDRRDGRRTNRFRHEHLYPRQ